MSKLAIGEKVNSAADAHESGTAIAVFPTVDGNFRYVVDGESYGVLQSAAEEELVAYPANLM
jgi:hypothetical protein